MKSIRLLEAALLLLFTLSVAHGQEGKNPLLAVAEYNIEADGSMATGDQMTAYGGHFKWDKLETLTLPKGYHIPTKEELMLLAGRFSMDENPRPPYPILIWTIDEEADEQVNLFGKVYTLSSHYYALNDGLCYALRFKGEDNRFFSAYKWEMVPKPDEKGKTLALKITCRLLGAEGIDTDIKALATKEFWESNNEHDVIRYFPSAGYGDYTGEDKVVDLNVYGRYWSCTPRKDSKNGAWGFGFDGSIIIVYNWIKTSAYSLRCFKDYGNGTAIVPVSNDRGDVSITVDPALRTVCVNGLATGTTVSLYSLTGELLYTEEAPSERIRIDLSSYAAGAYILSTGNTVHKLQL